MKTCYCTEKSDPRQNIAGTFSETNLTNSKATEANSLQIDHWHFKSFQIVTNQNDHTSVAFVMYRMITWIICWKTVVTGLSQVRKWSGKKFFKVREK